MKPDPASSAAEQGPSGERDVAGDSARLRRFPTEAEARAASRQKLII